MFTASLTDKEIELLRDVAYILRSGRVGDLVHESFPERVDALADTLDPQRRVHTRFGPVNR
jgi:hypothetical protein